MPAWFRPHWLLLLPILPAAPAQQLPPTRALAPATRIVDAATGRTLDWDRLLDQLAAADVVFLGETHLDDTTHRAELEVLDGLLARRHGKVSLSLEMFERDVQPALDDYLSGRIDEPAFLARARPWGNYATAYRPLVERAKAAGIPVVAANFPASLRRRLAMGGKKAFDELPPDQRALLPAEIHPASSAYWERVDRAVRGHMGGGGERDASARLYDGQNLWDNAMGDNVARALAAHPDRLVLHVAGGFHVAYRQGTVAQFALRAPAAKAVVASILPVPALDETRPERDRGIADYLIYALGLAREEDEGTFAVEVPAELRYRLSAPPGDKPAPLLLWLPDRATRPADAFAFWCAVLGNEAVVAVVEPPFPELQDDLAVGGRFASGDGFQADYGHVQHGLERIVEYLARRMHAGGRILIAGAGDGAAAVLWAALYSQWLETDMLALDPTDLARLGMEGLPDQQPPTRSLRLCAQTVAADRLQAVAADYRKVLAAGAVSVASLAPGEEPADVVRAALGLPPRAEAGEPEFLVLDRELPRARQWALLYAERLRRDGHPAKLVAKDQLPAAAAHVHRLRVGDGGEWPIASFAGGSGLPLAGGPFGGTTVLVLPADASDADRDAWAGIAQARAIKRRSMFANLVIAQTDREPSLAQVLRQLREQGRSRVLVVPAVFCADAAQMRQLRDQLGELGAGMDLSWLPGLGAELVH